MDIDDYIEETNVTYNYEDLSEYVGDNRKEIIIHIGTYQDSGSIELKLSKFLEKALNENYYLSGMSFFKEEKEIKISMKKNPEFPNYKTLNDYKDKYDVYEKKNIVKVDWADLKDDNRINKEIENLYNYRFMSRADDINIILFITEENIKISAVK